MNVNVTLSQANAEAIEALTPLSEARIIRDAEAAEPGIVAALTLFEAGYGTVLAIAD